MDTLLVSAKKTRTFVTVAVELDILHEIASKASIMVVTKDRSKAATTATKLDTLLVAVQKATTILDVLAKVATLATSQDTLRVTVPKVAAKLATHATSPVT
ncbi:hypothetical protein QAD02_023633 [Eretmocerus hayati]|uniref:Uncharacterized protein n=1 Tax=Eretmocerus hayati TaxID=131215 RepID=A0ACC2PX31_9HYME|nr:hypothetical protein QAD02_023633 [Eretmocerus hayati]